MDKIASTLYKTMLNLNLVELKKTLLKINTRFNDFVDYADDKDGFSPASTRAGGIYNILTFPYPEMYNFYKVIQQKFSEMQKLHYGKTLVNNYYAQAWLNLYKKGQYANWHDHGDNTYDSWHGFVGIDVGNSYTTYAIDKTYLKIPSVNNQLVIGLNGSKHRTYPWTEDYPRITVAFSILTDRSLLNFKGNHWVPI